MTKRHFEHASLWLAAPNHRTDAFIRLMITRKIKLSFISETEKGAKDKIAGRHRERERERALGGGRYSASWKMDC
jgi:hypothetical protein